MTEQREKLIELIKDITARPTTLENDVNYLIANGVVVLPCRCKDCEWWKYNGADDALIPPTCYGDDGEHFCSYGERKGGDE